MTDDQRGRDRLLAWRAEGPSNYYEASPNLARVLAVRAGSDRLAAMEPTLARFGRVVAETVEPAVAEVERHRQFPALLPYDGVGRSVATVELHPAHQRSGHAVWSSGLLAGPVHGTDSFTQAGLFYLLSFAGEGGHACPAVCTAGLTRAITHHGSPALQDRYLPGLTSTDYAHALRGSQFLTEVQGGSDVGANTTVARLDPAEDGSWRITGEKWFCSVADADLFAVTARPEGAPAGTRGLGCFVVPRTLDGTTPNGFRIRRLKDKLGTRALASAEIEFEGAVAWPIGEVDHGFRIAVEELLNTSRWLNAVGSTGLMRRAFLEASSYATYREAFGVPIITFPIVREQLALMKVEEHAALASTMALTGLVDRIDAGAADDHERLVHRFLVNANKYVTSIAATAVVHQAIELLGGNGTIEDFTPLPRLYRDAIVYESWEGTHNVLCAQVARDCDRFDLLGSVNAWVHRELETTGDRAHGVGAQVLEALERVQGGFRAAVGAGAPGAAGFRRRLDEVVRIIQAACLAVEAATAPGDQAEKEAVAMLFVRRYLSPGHDPDTDPDRADLVALALGADGT
jgi:hypothetical protein